MKIKKWLLKSEFAKNVITLISGTAIAQALSLIFSPVISRIYSPENVGFFAVFMSVVSGIAVIACGRFELTILLPKEDSEAEKNRSIALLFCSITSAITTLVIVILYLFNIIHSAYYLLTGILVFMLGLYQINTNTFLRNKDYKTIAKTRIINSFINTGLSICLGLLNFLNAGLILSNMFGQFIGNSFYKTKIFKQKINKTYLHSLKPSLIKYKHFLQFNTFQALSDMLMINVMYYMLPIFYSSTIVGLYAMAIRILQAPMSLIGSSIAQVFYQQAVEQNKEEKSLSGITKSTILKSAFIALPVPIILFFLGPLIFAFIFGDEWEAAGNIARILSPWIYLDFIRATISQIPLILNKQKELFRLSIVGNILLFSSLLIAGISNFSIEDNFLVISIIMCLFSLFLIHWIFNLTKENQNSN